MRRLIGRRRDFGITRVGAITRLDRVGIPVVQVVRPLALSNSVAQGKGATLAAAAASALMETLETWAGEQVAPRFTAPAAAVGPEPCALYGAWADGGKADWTTVPIAWAEGFDLFAGRTVPVPAALIDTIYTRPAPHPPLFPRTTTGLGAGASFAEALAQAGREVVERHAVARARRLSGFFDDRQVDLGSAMGPLAVPLLQRIRAAGLAAGAWQVPTEDGLPVYWAQVMGGDTDMDPAPLPADGFGCDASHDGALAKALLEACQARLSAISGAREDITRRFYPGRYDRARLAEWRRRLAEPPRARHLPYSDTPPGRRGSDLDRVLATLAAAGATAAIAVPLLVDTVGGLFVARLVAPPLALGAEGR
ncbi:YcaO-like family protein [Chelatococcus sp. SYSU_G07232]|uniref:YcaO-like family protein n=1 Tax=Chelatococcus albus TaxID=3047466 RepID=A0ABT7AFR0_9HYPH|nr:YcaO-like family protein [Chelatococcus sp. SYSU_G07232]MDJ1158194.1 YcaO-like family protein [Chelatococcus sp. SYSU_G07232]